MITNIAELVKEAKTVTKEGRVASYIPALQSAQAEDLGIALYDSHHYATAGDAQVPFTLQSISKVFTLALALMDSSPQEVFSKVGMEPTGDPFNSIIKLETMNPSRPLNPMINAGALAVTSMIHGKDNGERISRILHFIQRLANNSDLRYNAAVAASEMETAYLNRALCYYMKQNHIITGDIEELMDLYTKQCAIEVNCVDLARIGLIFALDGRDPITNEQLIPAAITRICKTFMVTCGMYNASGEFAIRVGIPAKSGVAGGILCCVKGRMGIGIYGPALDDKGNSIAGLELLERLSVQEQWSIF